MGIYIEQFGCATQYPRTTTLAAAIKDAKSVGMNRKAKVRIDGKWMTLGEAERLPSL